eukprot:3575418-Pleurochrysis_carterae.AAC.1
MRGPENGVWMPRDRVSACEAVCLRSNGAARRALVHAVELDVWRDAIALGLEHHARVGRHLVGVRHEREHVVGRLHGREASPRDEDRLQQRTRCAHGGAPAAAGSCVHQCSTTL